MRKTDIETKVVVPRNDEEENHEVRWGGTIATASPPSVEPRRKRVCDDRCRNSHRRNAHLP